MFKLIPLGARLLWMAALIGMVATSARARTSACVLDKQTMEFAEVMSSTTSLTEVTISQMLRFALGADNGVQKADSGLSVSASLLLTIWSNSSNLCEEDGNYNDKDEDYKKHAPTAEPSTLLSFGAAMAIGGCVFLLGRLRKVRT